MPRCAPLLLLVASAPAGAAEIVFTRLAVPDRAVEGEDVTFEAEVANTGALVLVGSVTVELRASIDRSWSADADPFLCQHTFAGGLGGGKSATARFACTWPTGVVGTWYVVGEASTPPLQDTDPANNRASAGPLLVVDDDAPDLVGELLHPPAAVRAGTTAPLDVRVHNLGKTDARATTTRVLLSTDTVLGAADVELCSLATPPVHGGGHLDRALAGCAVPPGAATGAAHLLLQVDAPPGVEVELDEANNLTVVPVTVEPPLPDLTLTRLLAPSEALPGATITVQYTVRNDGHAAADASTLDVRLSADATFDPGDAALCSATVPAVPPGSEVSALLAICTIPAATAPGGWQVVARIDADDTVVELDEDDNDRGVALEVRPRLPDLEVTSLRPPTPFAPGDTIAIPYTLANHGDADALTTTLAVFLSLDDTFDEADLELCRADVSAPPAGGTRNGQLPSCVVPGSLVPAPAWLFAVVDVDDTIEESVEDNNVTVADVTLVEPPDLRPDLRVTALTTTPQAHPGTSVSVVAAVENHGAGDAPETALAVALSSDGVTPTGDFFCRLGVAALAAGDTTTVDDVCHLPDDAPPGDRHLLVRVDPDRGVSEPDESDNDRASPLRVLALDDTGHTDAGHTDLGLDSDPFPVDTDAPRPREAGAPPRWFCRSGGEGGGLLVAALALALTRRRRR